MDQHRAMNAFDLSRSSQSLRSDKHPDTFSAHFFERLDYIQTQCKDVSVYRLDGTNDAT